MPKPTRFREQRSPLKQSWQAEKEHLLPLPQKHFDCCRRVEVAAAKNQLVRFENNFYSIPGAWVGQHLTLKAYVHRVEICSNRLTIASHRRSYGRGEEVYDLDHYLETLYKKPGALEDSKPYRRSKLPGVFQMLCSMVIVTVVTNRRLSTGSTIACITLRVTHISTTPSGAGNNHI